MLASLVADAGFNREQCWEKLKIMLASQSLYANDSSVFYKGKDGLPMSHPDNPVLTLTGCYEICAKGYGWYPDIGPRLLVPILVLVCNVDLSPLDKRRLLSVLHFLVDPIDSLWSF